MSKDNIAVRKQIGAYLADMRKSKRLLQSDIPGISRVTIGKIERGEQPYSIDHLITYTHILEVKVELSPITAGGIVPDSTSLCLDCQKRPAVAGYKGRFCKECLYNDRG